METLDEQFEIEICPYCDRPIVETNHQCEEPLDEYNYSDRLTKGFEMIDPDGEREKD